MLTTADPQIANGFFFIGQYLLLHRCYAAYKQALTIRTRHAPLCDLRSHVPLTLQYCRQTDITSRLLVMAVSLPRGDNGSVHVFRSIMRLTHVDCRVPSILVTSSIRGYSPTPNCDGRFRVHGLPRLDQVVGAAASSASPVSHEVSIRLSCLPGIWSHVDGVQRFTDSPIHDPYAATKGLFYSHCGWIFLKPSYPRLKLIERDDLESDPGEHRMEPQRK